MKTMKLSNESSIGIYGNDDRGNWGGRFESLLSMLGYAIGLGNVWRFPYLCVKNGGGAFFIPYLLILIFAAIPTFLLECSLGQFTSSGPTTCWECVPFFKGIGIAQVIISTYIGIYYNVIMSWALYYLLSSFQSPLPWSHCSNDWNNKKCSRATIYINANDCNGKTYYVSNHICYNATSLVGVTNRSGFDIGNGLDTPAQQFWRYQVMGGDPHARTLTAKEKVGSKMKIGGIDMDLPILLAICWLIVFACMIRGIKSSGKVVYVTATFPYAILIVLFLRGVTLPGAREGILYYITPDISVLGSPSVWTDAGGQIYFSLSCGQGGLMTLSSYNRFHSPTLRDTFIVCIGNCLTSFFAGFVIFSFIGYSAAQRSMRMEDASEDGAALAFQVYPEAVNTLPFPQLWSAIFFFMLLTLGMDSQFVFIEIVVTSVTDEFPFLRPHKWKLIGIDCLISYIFGLLYVAKGGPAWLDLVDAGAAGKSLLTVGIIECAVIGWIYGSTNFVRDIGCMIGEKPGRHWEYGFKFSSPIFSFGILMFSIVKSTPKHRQDDQFPVWYVSLEVLISLSALMWIVLTGIILYFLKTDKSLPAYKRIRSLFVPSDSWGPYLHVHRQLVFPDLVEVSPAETPEAIIKGSVNFASQIESPQLMECLKVSLLKNKKVSTLNASIHSHRSGSTIVEDAMAFSPGTSGTSI